LLAGTRGGHGADYLNAGIALGEQKRAGAIPPDEIRMQKLELNKTSCKRHASSGKRVTGDYLGSVIEQRDIAVWAAAALLTIGIGWSRYAKMKSRNNLVRQLAAMNVEQRKKMLSRLNPKVALELRQELLERFRIMT
jgi:hypothetical protein